MSYRVKNLILMIAALLTGCLLYMLFRPETYITKMVAKIIPMNINLTAESFIGIVCSYYLPDFLWAFSLSCGLCALSSETKKCIRNCCYIGFLSGLIWEIAQRTQLISGTGDMVDVLMYLLGALMCRIINKKGNDYEKD